VSELYRPHHRCREKGGRKQRQARLRLGRDIAAGSAGSGETSENGEDGKDLAEPLEEEEEEVY